MVPTGGAQPTVANDDPVSAYHAPTVGIDPLVRVVHISDTHGGHWNIQGIIPAGNILIHSGDVADIRTDEEYYEVLADFNRFLGSLPHTHKIYVSGNHEQRIAAHAAEETQKILTNAIYLQDSSVTISGITIYGTPWTNSGHGFSCPRSELPLRWAQIPAGVDILVTHMPPWNVLDCAWEGKDCGPAERCEHCNKRHTAYNHWGCPGLYKEVVERVRPKYHLFGHVHDDTGVVEREGVVFCNAAMDIKMKSVVFDIGLSGESHQPTVQWPAASLAWALQNGALRHLETGLVLDIDCANPQPAALVHVWPELSPPRPQQQWLLEESGGIVSLLNGMLLHCGDNGAPCMMPRDESAAQQWTLDKSAGALHNQAGWYLRAERKHLLAVRM